MKRHLVFAIALLFSLFPTLLSSARTSAAASPQSAAPLRLAHLQPVAVPARWTATSRTYRVGDRYVAHLYTTPVNYWAHGAWHAIDTTLVPSHQQGVAYQTRANSYLTSFPADLGEGMIRVQTSAGWLAFGLVGVHAHPSVTGNRAVYALPGARITYTATATSLKEGIALSGPSSPAQFHYRLHTSAHLTAHQLGNGGIRFTDRSGRVLFTFAPPSLRDAAGSTSRAVSLHLHGSRLTLSANTRWLHSAHRAYPVVIDPTTVVLNPSQGCTLNQAAPTTASCNTTGTLSNVSGAQKNILLQYNLSSIPSNSEVLDANLGLDVTAATGTASFNVNFYHVTRAWTTAATWNTYDGVHAWTTPGGDTTGVIVAENTSVYSNGPGWYYFQPVQLVQDWVNGIAANDGFEVTVTSPASSTLTVSASPAPSLTITYAPWFGIQDYWTFVNGVNVANGNFVAREDDLAMPGIDLHLMVRRFYNGLNASQVGAFGSGWSASDAPDVKLTINSDGVVDYTGPSGFQFAFQPVPVDPNCRGLCGPGFASPPGIDADLANTGNGYTITFHLEQLKFNFNLSGLLTSEVDRSGNSLLYTYDASNRLSSITDTQGRTTTFAYTSPVSSTLISQITDPAGHTYGYTYDSGQNLTVYTDPAGHTTQYSYDASHELTQITDPNGNEAQFSHDGSHRITAIKAITNNTTGAGYSTTFTYNSGNTVVTDANGHTSTYFYDGRGRVTTFRDGKGNNWQSSWNSNNDIASQTTPSGNLRTFTYDSHFNLTSESSPSINGVGLSQTCAYADSTWIYQPSSCTDEQGHTTTFSYNSQGLLSGIGDPAGHSSSTVYNSNGTIASETDDNGHTKSFSYYTSGTSVGLQQQETPPSPLGTIQYSYNSSNLESAMTDGNGKTTTYSYDALGRVTNITYADGKFISYTYDAGGRVLSMTDSTGTTSYTYNTLDEVTSKRLPAGPYLADGHSVDYTYDPVGNLLTKQDTAGTISYTYDANDQAIGVTDRAGRSYTISYDQDANRTSIAFPNGVTESMAYNSGAQLTQISASNASQQTLVSFSYSYINPSTNQPTSMPYSVTDLQGNTTSYTYDANSLLTQATKRSSGGTTLASYSFGYDAGGRMTSKTVGGVTTTFNYNAADELTSAAGGTNVSYTYDGNGDRTSSSDGMTITLNAAGQVASITPPGGLGRGTPINYTYTGVGEEQRVGAGSTTFQFDGAGLNLQTDSAGNTTTYTTLPDGSLLSETVPNGTYAGTYYYLTDGAGNVVAITNSTGAISNSYSYDPLGNATSTGSVPNAYTFKGGAYDSQTGYYFTGNGYYDPANGQNFGCKDHGSPTDPSKDVSEDSCGEDEGSSTGTATAPRKSLFHELFQVGVQQCKVTVNGYGSGVNRIVIGTIKSECWLPTYLKVSSVTLYEQRKVKGLPFGYRQVAKTSTPGLMADDGNFMAYLARFPFPHDADIKGKYKVCFTYTLQDEHGESYPLTQCAKFTVH